MPQECAYARLLDGCASFPVQTQAIEGIEPSVIALPEQFVKLRLAGLVQTDDLAI
jgi:hypothetical protein